MGSRLFGYMYNRPCVGGAHLNVRVVLALRMDTGSSHMETVKVLHAGMRVFVMFGAMRIAPNERHYVVPCILRLINIDIIPWNCR